MKRKNIGYGFLRFDHFKDLLDENPQIRDVELSNWGEVLLNRELPKMLEYAYQMGVATRIEEGVNLNDAPLETLEALVAFKTKVIRCAIDGVTNESYRRYRIGGDLKRVIANIKAINEFKEKYGSSEPRLVFQFILSSDNLHELEGAVLLSRLLKMEIFFKPNYFTQSIPSHQFDLIRKYSAYRDEEEFLQNEGRHCMRHQCYQLWTDPQINWDGRLLGCSRNIWGHYAENVFQDGFIECLNNKKMDCARRMLMGKAEATTDIPCVNCSLYRVMVESGKWITEEELHL
jgi:MoaA/NifB/PqqE/SkfB family radical SAM enzyme